MTLRLGVLASGSGSNLQSILDACAARRIDAEVAVVLCNVPGARALQRAADARVPSRLVDHRGIERAAYDEALVVALREHRIDLVCLAGFMRIIGPGVLASYENKILNIHPSLLPAFPGMHAVRQALNAGVRISGCTVHVVDAGTDTGPIVVQAAVPVVDGDTEETLAARILAQEHRCYPRAIGLFAEGRVELRGRKVMVRAAAASGTIASPPLDDDR